MNPRLRIGTDDRLTISGVAYRLLSQTPDGVCFEALDGSGARQVFGTEAFRDLLDQPDVLFEPNALLVGHAEARLASGEAFWSNLDRSVRQVTLWRYAYVMAFLAFEAQGKIKRVDHVIMARLPELEVHANGLARAEQSKWKCVRAGQVIGLRKPPCAKSLRIWLKRYETSGGDIHSLVPRTHRSGNRQDRFCLKTRRLIGQAMQDYQTQARLSRKNVHELFVARFAERNEARQKEGKPELTPPSLRMIERAIAKLDPYFTYVQRYGQEAANRKFALYEEGIAASYPMERVEIDEWKVDLITILAARGALDHMSPDELAKLERGRRWLYVAIDCATRCIVGLRVVRAPNSEDSIALLADITRDKSELAAAAGARSPWHHHGGLATVATDLGAAFVDEGFRSAIIVAHGAPETPPGGLPQLRGRIERVFRTFGTHLMPHMAGRTFSNSKERGDYPSEAMASLSDDALAEMLVRYVVDVYHNTPHAALKGETPNDCWARLVKKGGIAPPPCAQTRVRAFGARSLRTVSGRGIVLYGIDYTCAALREVYLHRHDRKVEVKADLNDLGWVLVRIGQGWHVASALQSCFDGVSFEDWQRAARELRLKHKAQAALHEGTVRAALQAISQINAAEQDRFKVALKKLTPAGLQRGRDDLFLGLSIVAERGEGFDLPPEADLFGHALRMEQGRADTAAPEPGAEAEPPSEAGASKASWRVDNE